MVFGRRKDRRIERKGWYFSNLFKDFLLVCRVSLLNSFTTHKHQTVKPFLPLNTMPGSSVMVFA